MDNLYKFHLFLFALGMFFALAEQKHVWLGMNEILIPISNEKNGDERQASSSHRELRMQLVDSEDHYNIKNDYNFLLPIVNVSCQFSPTKSSNSQNFPTKIEPAKDSTLTVLLENDLDCQSVGDHSYKMCCLVDFVVSEVKSCKYKAVQLAEISKTYKFSLSLSEGGQVLERDQFSIASSVERFLYGDDLVIEVEEQARSPLESDSWYYMRENSEILMSGIPLNGENEQDFQKLGWFHYDQDGNLATFDSDKLKKHMQFSFKTFSNPLLYEWNFNAKYYYKDHEQVFPKLKNMPLQERYKDSISSIYINKRKRTIVSQFKPTSPMKLEIRTFDAQDQTEIFFHAEILKIGGVRRLLSLKFVSGTGNVIVTVEMSKREKFYFKLLPNSADPVPFDRYLENPVSESVWICVKYCTGFEQSVCRFVKVEDYIGKSQADDLSNKLNEKSVAKITVLEWKANDMHFTGVTTAFVATVFILLLVVFWLIFKAQNRNGKRRIVCPNDHCQPTHDVETPLLVATNSPSIFYVGGDALTIPDGFICFKVNKTRLVEMKRLVFAQTENDFILNVVEANLRKAEFGVRVDRKTLFETNLGTPTRRNSTDINESTVNIICPESKNSGTLWKLIEDFCLNCNYLSKFNRLFIMLPKNELTEHQKEILKHLEVLLEMIPVIHEDDTSEGLILIQQYNLMGEKGKSKVDAFLNRNSQNITSVVSCHAEINNVLEKNGNNFGRLARKQVIESRHENHQIDSLYLKKVLTYVIIERINCFISKVAEHKKLYSYCSILSCDLNFFSQEIDFKLTGDILNGPNEKENIFAATIRNNLQMCLQALYVILQIHVGPVDVRSSEMEKEKLIQKTLERAITEPMLLSILTELMPSKNIFLVGHLLKTFVPWSFSFTPFLGFDGFSKFLHMFGLQKILKNREIASIITSNEYLPPILHLTPNGVDEQFCKTSNFELLVQIGLESKRIHSICWDFRCYARLPQKIKIKKLELNFGEIINPNIQNDLELECEECAYAINYYTEQNWEFIKDILTKVKCPNKYLAVRLDNFNSFCHTLYKDLTIGSLKHVTIFSLKCCWDENEKGILLKMISDLIKKSKISDQICIDLLENSEQKCSIAQGILNSFLKDVTASPSLTKFSLNFSKNFKSLIDPNILANNNQKRWLSLSFGVGVQFLPLVNSLHANAMEFGSLDSFDDNHKIIALASKLKMFGCDRKFFHNVTKSADKEWYNLEKLTIRFRTLNYWLTCLVNLIKLKNLKVLTLDFEGFPYDPLDSADISHLIAFLDCQFLDELRFEGINDENITYLRIFLKNFNEFKMASEQKHDEKQNVVSRESQYVFKTLVLRCSSFLSEEMMTDVFKFAAQTIQRRNMEEFYVTHPISERLRQSLLCSFPPTKHFQVKRKFLRTENEINNYESICVVFSNSRKGF